jgi:hypothetical protein
VQKKKSDEARLLSCPILLSLFLSLFLFENTLWMYFLSVCKNSSLLVWLRVSLLSPSLFHAGFASAAALFHSLVRLFCKTFSFFTTLAPRLYVHMLRALRKSR